MSTCAWCGASDSEDAPLRVLPLRPIRLCPTCTRTYYAERD